MRESKDSQKSLETSLPAPEPHPVGWRRVAIDVPAVTMTIDPVRDAVTGEVSFETDEEALTINVSRRGVCLRCLRPPEVGTRFLLQLALEADERPIERVGRTRWSRVEYLPGDHGARAVAVVGVELMGGSRRALDAFCCA